MPTSTILFDNTACSLPIHALECEEHVEFHLKPIGVEVGVAHGTIQQAIVLLQIMSVGVRNREDGTENYAELESSTEPLVIRIPYQDIEKYLVT